MINLHKTRRRRRRLTNGPSSTGEAMNPIILMLLALSTTFLLLETPGVIIGIKTAMDEYFTDDGAGFGTPSELLIRSLFRIIYFLTCLNHSINFVLYFVSTRDFRTELVKIFKEICKCGKQRSNISVIRSSSNMNANSYQNKPEDTKHACTNSAFNADDNVRF